jgi:UDP-GlcNAc:undecaprenyl-phosphate/decaprenyl-phosphate GlcNAc-1-phosphate transferase
MPEDLFLPAAFVLALGVTALATPAAIAVARRTRFYDHPRDYKRHSAPTPYLGGTAVLAGVLLASAALRERLGDFDTVVVIAVALLVVGTLDDRIGLNVGVRVLAEAGAAIALFYSGIGWAVFGSEVANLALTILFVLAVVNAFNLMDNLDGATTTIALVSALTLALFAAVNGYVPAATLAIALAGACAAFLPYNLALPRARIFLGDGGSMAIGITLAGLFMSLPETNAFGWELVPVIVVLVGLPALDTALVIASRLRRRVPVLSGGRDHLSHRLLAGLGSCRRVAVALAGAQAVLSGLAIVLIYLGPKAAAAGAVTLLVSGMVLIAVMEAPGWRSWALRARARISRSDEPTVSRSAASRSAAQDESPA